MVYATPDGPSALRSGPWTALLPGPASVEKPDAGRILQGIGRNGFFRAIEFTGFDTIAYQGEPPERLEERETPLQRIGPYEVIGVVGTGGMGIVYRAYDPAAGRHVALKLIKGEVCSKNVARFIREARVTASLRHPSIVRIHASGTDRGRVWIAYELVEGARTLRELMPGLEPTDGARLVL